MINTSSSRASSLAASFPRRDSSNVTIIFEQIDIFQGDAGNGRGFFLAK